MPKLTMSSREPVGKHCRGYEMRVDEFSRGKLIENHNNINEFMTKVRQCEIAQWTNIPRSQ